MEPSIFGSTEYDGAAEMGVGGMGDTHEESATEKSDNPEYDDAKVTWYSYGNLGTRLGSLAVHHAPQEDEQPIPVVAVIAISVQNRRWQP